MPFCYGYVIVHVCPVLVCKLVSLNQILLMDRLSVYYHSIAHLQYLIIKILGKCQIMMPQITALFLFPVDTYVTHVYDKRAMITGIIRAYFL